VVLYAVWEKGVMMAKEYKPSTKLKAPFPWFGGKSRAAHLVWSALGDVDNYVEPFAGSLAVLLARPHAPNTETVNDIDRYIVNFWRALQHDPAGVAHHANNPANESDLIARHIWLVNSGADRIARIDGDPDYFDSKVAGWWAWGISCWIGSGWCAGNGPWGSIDGKLVNLRDGYGDCVGVWRQRMHLGHGGQGVNRKLLHLGDGGRGVNRKRVHLDGASCSEANIFEYLNTLACRLRYVRVCCGDWARVVTRGSLSQGSTVGIFFDPPYDTDIRANVYRTDGEHGQISADVRRWCLENGDNPRYLIVLAGYEDEHGDEMPDSWHVIEWSASRAYGTSGGDTTNSENRKKERLWLSPNCLVDERDKQLSMF